MSPLSYVCKGFSLKTASARSTAVEVRLVDLLDYQLLGPLTSQLVQRHLDHLFDGRLRLLNRAHRGVRLAPRVAVIDALHFRDLGLHGVPCAAQPLRDALDLLVGDRGVLMLVDAVLEDRYLLHRPGLAALSGRLQGVQLGRDLRQPLLDRLLLLRLGEVEGALLEKRGLALAAGLGPDLLDLLEAECGLAL